MLYQGALCVGKPCDIHRACVVAVGPDSNLTVLVTRLLTDHILNAIQVRLPTRLNSLDILPDYTIKEMGIPLQKLPSRTRVSHHRLTIILGIVTIASHILDQYKTVSRL